MPCPDRQTAEPLNPVAHQPVRSRDVYASYADGAFYSLMVGCGESYLAAFALAVGISQVATGLLSSVPLLIAGLVQLAAPLGSRRLGSYKRWVLLCASLQAVSCLVLAAGAHAGTMPVLALYFVASLYWASGMAAGPAWNNLIDGIIPRWQLPRYLAIRSWLTQTAAFLAFLGAGLALHSMAGRSLAMPAFLTLFLIAGACRLLSVGCLSLHTDAPPPAGGDRRLPLRDLIDRFRSKDQSRFLIFILATQISVNVSAVFFSPYMLGHVRFSYGEYVALVSAAFAGRIAFFPLIAHTVRRLGAWRALWMSVIVVAPAPLFWFWTPSLAPLMTLQVVAGAAWGVFELAASLLIFDRIPTGERIQVLTWYNALSAAAVVSGSLLGAGILQAWPGYVGYRFAFSTSAALRLLSVLVLIGAAGRTVRFFPLRFRTVGVRPARGSLDQPIFTADEEKEPGG